MERVANTVMLTDAEYNGLVKEIERLRAELEIVRTLTERFNAAMAEMSVKFAQSIAAETVNQRNAIIEECAAICDAFTEFGEPG